MSDAPSAATAREVSLMRHMLGASHPSSRLGWRNYGAWPEDDRDMQSMLEKGLVTKGARLGSRLVCWHVTEEWRAALGAKSP